MLVYGRNPVREALRGNRSVDRVWATRTTQREPWLVETIRSGSPALTHAEGSELDELCGHDEHQGICAEVSDFQYVDATSLLQPDDAFVLVLDEIQDPQNLGAIARVAECSGVTGIVLPERRTAEVNPAVCKASAGAVEHLAVARVRNVADYLIEAKQAGAWVYGADASGDTPYNGPDFAGRVVLVMGSEGRGLRERVAKNCDALLTLPLQGKIESLNVATAAAVMLYAILQDRLHSGNQNALGS